MLITGVERQVKNPDRFSVFIDGKFAFGIDGTDLLYHKISSGRELTPDEYEHIIKETELVKAKDAALRFLSYRMRSRFELIQKLREKEFGEDITDRILAMFTKYGYIDDLKFSKQYILEKRKLLNCGRKRITFELRQKGVDLEKIDSAFEEITDAGGEDSQADTDIELQTAVKSLQKKLKGKTISNHDELKNVYGYLIRRGFSYDLAKKAVMTYNEDIQNND